MTKIYFWLIVLTCLHYAQGQSHSLEQVPINNDRWHINSIGAHLGQGTVNGGPSTVNYGMDLVAKKNYHLLKAELTKGVAWNFSIGDPSNKSGNYQLFSLGYGRSYHLSEHWQASAFLGLSHVRYHLPTNEPLSQRKSYGFGLPLSGVVCYQILENWSLGIRGQIHPNQTTSTTNLSMLVSWNF